MTTMPSWRTGYKVGVFCLFVGVLMYVVGFSVPYWISFTAYVYVPGVNFSFDNLKTRQGLWEVCYDSSTINGCDLTTPAQEVWREAVQSLQCMGLVCCVVTCGLAVLAICCLRNQKLNNLTGVAGIIGSCVGLIGLAVYAAKTEQIVDDSNKAVTVTDDVTPTVRAHTALLDLTYEWGFCLDAAGCVLSLLGSALVLLFNPFVPQPPAAPMSTAYPVVITDVITD